MRSGQRRYWDTDAFLGYLNGEAHKSPGCQGVIQAAEEGRVSIITSTLTLAEVLWLKGHKPLAPDKAEEVKRFFQHEWIILAELDRPTAELGRELFWQHFPNLQAKDAVHVATAVRTRATRIDTFDGGLIALSGKIGSPLIEIGPPDLPLQQPLFEKQLP